MEGQVTHNENLDQEELPEWMKEEPSPSDYRVHRKGGIFHILNDPFALFIIRGLGWANVLTNYQVKLLSITWKFIKGIYDTITAYHSLVDEWEHVHA